MHENKQEVTNVNSLVKMAAKSPSESIQLKPLLLLIVHYCQIIIIIITSIIIIIIIIKLKQVT